MKKGDKIRILRIIKGLSQENMAEMMGMSRLSYGDIERNKTILSKNHERKIAEILNISASDIESVMDSVGNFFEYFSSLQVNAETKNSCHNSNFDYKELLHQIEVLQLKLDKAEVEIKYWKEKLDYLKE